MGRGTSVREEGGEGYPVKIQQRKVGRQISCLFSHSEVLASDDTTTTFSLQIYLVLLPRKYPLMKRHCMTMASNLLNKMVVPVF